MTFLAVEMIRSSTNKGGWELLYKGLAAEIANAGIMVPQKLLP
jgi:hypothetical protein